MITTLLKKGAFFWALGLGVLTAHKADAQYCAPPGTTLHQIGINIMTNVTIAGTTLNSSNGAPSNGYTLVPSTPATNTGSLMQGYSYNFVATIGSGPSTLPAAIWIDYDANGTFDAAEYIPLPSSGPVTAMINVPINATPGPTAMRVRLGLGTITAASACNTLFIGETEDYTINILQAPPCSGTPIAGTAVTTVPVACPTQPYTLSLSGATMASGLVYQWEEAPAGTGIWSPISAGTAPFYTTTLNGATDYRCSLTCGAFSATSSIVTVTEANWTTCYCNPIIGNILSSQYKANFIESVDVPTTTLNNPTNSSNPNGYAQFNPAIATNTATFYPGISYNLNVGVMNTQYNIAGAWIDFDADGLLDNITEYITLTLNGNVGYSGNFTVPLTATTGLTGMRIRVNDAGNNYGGTDLDACDDDQAGETEDYLVTIGTLNNCAGQPAHATAIGPSTICENVDFDLIASGMEVGAGVTYDWQSNDGSGWMTTGNATNMMTVSGGITIPTSYRLVTNCSLSNQFDTSSVVAVTINPFYECYCSPLTNVQLSMGADDFITSVEVSPGTLSNLTGGFSPTAYVQFSPSVASNTTTLSPGATYNITVGMLYPQWDEVGAWIDYDGDGAMNNTSEFITLTKNGVTGATGQFTVPLSAAAGLAGLRVRVNDNGNSYGGTNLSACDDDGAGETEDYIITIPVLTNCTGQPAHAAINGPSSICPNVDLSMYASAMTVGLGVTYDWQADDGSGWISTGETSTAYLVAGGITIPTSYRLITLCSLTNLRDTSAILAVGVNQFYECYCSPLNGTTLASQGTANFVTSVDIPTTTLNNPTTTSNSNGYSLFDPSTSNYTATLYPGITYNINVGMMNPQWNTPGAWIDFDGDGTMDNTTEFINVTNNGIYGVGTFTVPTGATAGLTALRVRVNDNGYTYGGTNQGPCDDDEYGETEDYVVTIPVLTNCTGTPAHATVTGPAGICPGNDFMLIASGMSIALGVTYDWQADDGTGWLSTGGTNITLPVSGGITVPTSYRLISHCASTNLFDTSNVLALTINSFYECYCSPLDGTVLVSQYQSNFAISVDIQGTTLNNPTTNSGPAGYTQYSPLASPSYTTDLLQGVTYTINVGLQNAQYNESGAWLDFDGDGSFNNTNEFIALTNGTTGSSGTFVMPATSVLGMTGLRIRVNDYGNTYGGTNQGPCDDDGAGETEDYVVNVLVAPSCLPPSGFSTANITTTSADISWTSTSTLHEMEYAQGSSFAIGTGTPVSVGSTNPYTITGLSPSLQYAYYVRAICGPGDTSIWTMGSPFYTACGPVTSFPWDDDVEGQPTNYGNGQMDNCWNASPTPSGNNYEWFVGSGAIGTNNSGPSGPYSGSRCFYTEAYPGSLGDTAKLTTPELNITGVTTPYLGFYYHMYGNSIGKLVVEIFDGTGWDRVDSIVGQQQTSKIAPWLPRNIPLAGYTGVIQVRFEATRGASNTSFIAMDDISITSTPLAVKLDKISAVNTGKSNRVEWNTLSEEESDKFELQRSANGKDFQMLSPVKANGKASHYTYMDHTPFQGYNYYRLLMKEANGKDTYSDIVKAFVRSSGFSVEAYPNPVTDNLTVNVTGVQGSNATIQLTDVTGKVIKMMAMKSSNITINMNGLASGIYLIKYTDADHTQTMKIDKQ